MRPSSTAFTMVEKLSSASTTLAASRATSVPFNPMATPTSALRRAGASLTPSPVMAISSPCFCSVAAMRNFMSGVNRAKTFTSAMAFSNSFSSSASNWLSVSAVFLLLLSESIIPVSYAMAMAVLIWSPVAIITLIPACLHNATACFASGRGGSIIPARPAKVNWCISVSSILLRFVSRLASAITRMALPDHCSIVFLIFSFSFSVIGIIPLAVSR